MRDTALLVGLAALVIVCVLVERMLRRRGHLACGTLVWEDRQEADTLAAHFASATMLHVALNTLDSIPPSAPIALASLETRNPATWQGDGARDAEASVREQTAPRIYGAGPRGSNAVGVRVRGRIHARALIALDFKACGRDLMPILAEALVSGCPCQRLPQLRRIG